MKADLAMPTVCIPVGDVTVDLIEQGDRVAEKFIRNNCYEPESLKVWAEIVKPGLAAVDVGSYSGLFGIAAFKLGARPVFCIEPMPQMTTRTMDNSWLNEAQPVVLQAAACDDSGATGVMQFIDPTDSRPQLLRVGSIAIRYSGVPGTTGATITDKPLATKGVAYEISVSTMRLDDLMPSCNRVAALKIDVEHAEARVLRGASLLIARDWPTIIVEALSEAELGEAMAELPRRYAVARKLDKHNVLLVPASAA